MIYPYLTNSDDCDDAIVIHVENDGHTWGEWNEFIAWGSEVTPLSAIAILAALKLHELGRPSEDAPTDIVIDEDGDVSVKGDRGLDEWAIPALLELKKLRHHPSAIFLDECGKERGIEIKDFLNGQKF